MTSRSITGLVLAALLAAPAAAQAQSRSSGSGIWLGGLFGLETGAGFSGYQLRIDGEVPIVRLTPAVALEGVGSVSYAGLSHSTSVFSLVPAARVNWAATREIGAYADVGLGFYHAWNSDTGTNGAVMRFLVGGYYEMNTSTRFFIESGFHPYFGDFASDSSITSFTLMLGAKFRI